MCALTFERIHIYTHAYTNIHARIGLHKRTRTHSLHRNTRTHTQTYTHACSQALCTHTQTYTHAYTNILACIYKDTCTHVDKCNARTPTILWCTELWREGEEYGRGNWRWGEQVDALLEHGLIAGWMDGWANCSCNYTIFKSPSHLKWVFTAQALLYE